MILFYQFALGTLLSFVFFFEQVSQIELSANLLYPVLSGIMGFSGQYLVTKGYGYITAPESGIVATSRILIAAILGPYVALEASLGLTGWIGALIIFMVNVRLHLRETGKSSS